jgi:hypothetical protein
MILTLPDMATPAQPPTDGVREFLAFTAMTVALYLFGVIAIAALACAVR